MPATFIVGEKRNRLYSWVLKAKNGKVIANGGEFRSKQSCIGSIESLRNLAHSPIQETKEWLTND